MDVACRGHGSRFLRIWPGLLTGWRLLDGGYAFGEFGEGGQDQIFLGRCLCRGWSWWGLRSGSRLGLGSVCLIPPSEPQKELALLEFGLQVSLD